MLTKEIRKGTIVHLRNGFRARVEDNMVNGSTRLCTVFGAESGFFDEMGSVYTTDIVTVELSDGSAVLVTFTEKQKLQMKNRSSIGF